MVRLELTAYCLGGSRSDSAELHHQMFLMVGVGIEPTFAAFQTAANPSQLSDQIRCSWKDSNLRPLVS